MHKHAYSALHMCLGCGGLGDPYWVDMYEKSPTYLLCVECRNPPKPSLAGDGTIVLPGSSTGKRTNGR